ncbi:hypothetical protein [Micromonospora sp. NPDC049282]|uniref:hypothetical protein n=1 Tax=Micromonospora sp. NPDC049282 TaxID=3364269 RepID=UPI003721BD27
MPGVAAHEHQPVPPDFWFLRRGDGGWEIGPYERGRYRLRCRYPTEAEATAALFHILARPPRPGPAGGYERMAP